MRLAVDRDLALFHRLQERALRLRRRAVDLVRHHELGEHGAAMELEASAPAVVDGDPDDVGRQEVARELDALVREAEHARERVRERRLADARNVLDQEVPAGEEAGECEAHFAVLAKEHLVEARERRQQRAARRVVGMGLRVHRSEATRSCCSAS
jgi:hypothetical protein